MRGENAGRSGNTTAVVPQRYCVKGNSRYLNDTCTPAEGFPLEGVTDIERNPSVGVPNCHEVSKVHLEWGWVVYTLGVSIVVVVV